MTRVAASIRIRQDGAMSDDARLIEQARAGDLDAFAELVRSYERRVRGMLTRLLDDPRDVEEATQDTFVQAWRALDRFEGRSTVFTWLYRIAVNTALMRQRRTQLPTQELDEAAERRLARPEPDTVETAELRDFLLARIRALPFEYRAPLVLRDLEGLANAEVAEALGLGLAAAKSRIHRARMTIRAELEEWERGS
jgi:RNA polymerase sigma-70 factor (ECF subfamily)